VVNVEKGDPAGDSLAERDEPSITHRYGAICGAGLQEGGATGAAATSRPSACARGLPLIEGLHWLTIANDRSSCPSVKGRAGCCEPSQSASLRCE
jgi:hypothetical protein